jgi:hypothetical protein
MLGVGRELVMHSSCAATRKDGRGCTLATRPGSIYCFAHDPVLDEQRQQARAKGGRNKRSSVRAVRRLSPDLHDVLAALYSTLAGLQTGEADPRVASATAAVASAIVRVYGTAELEQRLEALEGRHAQWIR